MYRGVGRTGGKTQRPPAHKNPEPGEGYAHPGLQRTRAHKGFVWQEKVYIHVII